MLKVQGSRLRVQSFKMEGGILNVKCLRIKGEGEGWRLWCGLGSPWGIKGCEVGMFKVEG